MSSRNLAWFELKTAKASLSSAGQLRMPVLILHGGQDRVVPAGNAHLMAARIPTADVHVFPHAGHLFLWECADEANQMLVEFLHA